MRDYSGIPYLRRGRDRQGLDCWGLVRLWYRDELGLALPSFADLDDGEAATAQELAARAREQWRQVETPEAGDVILLRGDPLHVGVVLAPGLMLHTTRKLGASAVERYDTGRWRHRVQGFFRYAPGVQVSGCPHPLRMARVDDIVQPGRTILAVVEDLCRRAGWSLTAADRGLVWLDGVEIPFARWGDVCLAPGSRLEFRVLPGDDGTFRMVAMVAVMALAVWTYNYVAVAALFSTSLGLTAVSTGYMIGAVAAAGVAAAGMLLVDAIFPVRLPKPPQGSADTGPESQFLLQGVSNAANPYGPVPVVLGRMRVVAPLAATAYAESDATTSYLRMLLCWGVGPLQVTDLRIGDTRLAALSDIDIETVGGYSDDDLTALESIYGQDVTQLAPGVELVNNEDIGAPWYNYVLTDECDSISVTLHFPQGLRKVPLEGSTAGSSDPCPFALRVQWRLLDSDTLAVLTEWGDVQTEIARRVISLSPATDPEFGDVYQWTRISVDERCRIIVRTGSLTQAPDEEPSGGLLARLQADLYGVGAEFAALPEYDVGEESLWDVLVCGDEVVSTVDRRGATGGLAVTGCGLSVSGLRVAVSAGSITRAAQDTVRLGDTGQPFCRQKDAFSHTVNWPVIRGRYEIRLKRTTSSVADHIYTSGNKGYKYHVCTLQAVTGYRSARPVDPPAPLALTAIRVRATAQLNSRLDAISATVTSICPDWDAATGTWITRTTRNPASLFRWVLQHPANARRVPDGEIDLTALADWHQFCRVNGFWYDYWCNSQRSLPDCLADIAAAGRASPQRVDGRWTVVIDRPRSVVAQHFTPHNSWDFEGSRTFAQIPHAFRVQFANSRRGYQPDERLVYADGYARHNATLIEGLELPGVTTPEAVYRHARFHLAQLILRPETYTFSVDIEQLICTRGDLVRVTHDVPMWGLASGRVSGVSGATLRLDESVYLESGTAYTIRFRLATGASLTRALVPVEVSDRYSQITLVSAASGVQPGDLWMLGELGAESVLLLVKGIEAGPDYSARLTCVDYAPAVYTADSEAIPDFDSQITLPASPLARRVTGTPEITRVVSDESVLLRLAPGVWSVVCRVSWSNPAGLADAVTSVEGQIRPADDISPVWRSRIVDLARGNVAFDDVFEGAAYQLRLRYVDAEGRTGPWSAVVAHTVTGKLNPPSLPTGLALDADGQALRLSWASNPEPDLEGYEVRLTDSGWGEGGHLFRGSATSCALPALAPGQTGTWWLRAIDVCGLYSASAQASFTAEVVPAPVNLRETFADTALTSATITLDWDDVAAQYGLSHYEVQVDGQTRTIRASTITLPADWLGERTYRVRAIDRLGNASGYADLSVTKLPPGQPQGARAQVIDNTVMLYWTLPARTTLPISHIEIRRGASWATAELVGRKDGEFSTISELRGGRYTYWLACVDTDGYASAPVSVTCVVGAPPDFVFHGSETSALDGELTSAALSAGEVVLPVDLTETWETHFTARSWASPQEQVTAGFPRYAQPAPFSAAYSEVFDFGLILASSRVTLAWSGSVTGGEAQVTPELALSADGADWTAYPGLAEVFGVGFRFVRVTLDVESDGSGLYRLASLTVRGDAKQRSDSASASLSAADSEGTIVNFSVNFVRVMSVTLTPSGTAARSVTYEYPEPVAGSYVAASGVVTVAAAGHGLAVGQAVRLSPSSGPLAQATHYVTALVEDGFEAETACADGAGGVYVTAQGLRARLHDQAGVRVSGTASWTVRGY